MKKLFVGNLSYATSESALRDMFEKYGPLATCCVIKDRITKESKGFGFVEIENNASATQAIQDLNGQMVDGKALTVNEARPQVNRQEGGNWSGRSGSGSSDGGSRRFR